jgi:hypothetical protein
MLKRPQFEQKTERRLMMDSGLCGGVEPIPPNWLFAVQQRVNVSSAGGGREGAGRFQ